MAKNSYRVLLIMCLFFFEFQLNAQKKDSLQKPFLYEFKIIEGNSESTLNQSLHNVLTLNRIITRSLTANESKSDRMFKILIPAIGLGISHEEGHRSVLTDLNIGSISQPFSFDTGYLYVKGVSDETLLSLRDNSLPDYIHLHTAGLESDYMSVIELESLISFELDSYQHLKYDYLIRKISHLYYFLSTITRANAS